MLIWILIAIFLVVLIFGFFIQKKNEELAKQQELDDKTTEDYIKNFEASRQVTYNSYIEVFKSRLLTLEDDKSITFQQAGMIELKLFYENINELIDKIRIEEYEMFNLQNYSANLRLNLETSLYNSLKQSNTTLQLYGMKLFEEKLLEIANSKPEGI